MVEHRAAAWMILSGAIALTACGGGSGSGAGGGGSGGGSTTASTGTGSSGPIACASPSDPMPRKPCPDHGTIPLDTALPTLALGQEIAQASLGASAKWTTGILGLGITREGKIAASGLSGWVFGFCSGMDQFSLDTTNGHCGAERDCGVLDCDAVPAHAFPTIDSSAAISTAFPAEGADATYKIDINYLAGQTYWSVTSLQSKVTVKVDGDTGMIVP